MTSMYSASIPIPQPHLPFLLKSALSLHLHYRAQEHSYPQDLYKGRFQASVSLTRNPIHVMNNFEPLRLSGSIYRPSFFLEYRLPIAGYWCRSLFVHHIPLNNRFSTPSPDLLFSPRRDISGDEVLRGCLGYRSRYW